jgi:hypothetical protein
VERGSGSVEDRAGARPVEQSIASLDDPERTLVGGHRHERRQVALVGDAEDRRRKTRRAVKIAVARQDDGVLRRPPCQSGKRVNRRQRPRGVDPEDRADIFVAAPGRRAVEGAVRTLDETHRTVPVGAGEIVEARDGSGLIGAEHGTHSVRSAGVGGAVEEPVGAQHQTAR